MSDSTCSGCKRLAEILVDGGNLHGAGEQQIREAFDLYTDEQRAAKAKAEEAAAKGSK